MGSVVVVGPVRGENLVGLAAEQEVELLVEEVVDLFAEPLIEIGHLPAAELEALGWILGRPAGRLHDAIHGNHGADDNLPHGSLSLSVHSPHLTTLLRAAKHAMSSCTNARPVLLNLGEPGGFDITPWADRVQLIDVGT